MMYDIGIIGGGPGGYVAAIKAAQMGAKVILFEEDHLGGTCLNHGCIPTKAILQSAMVYRQVKEAAMYGVNVGQADIDFSRIMKRKEDIVHKLVGGVGSLLKKNGVKVVNARATLRGNHFVAAGNDVYEFKNIILATGSKPASIPVPGAENAKDSTYVLSMDTLPSSMAIVGGGVIGLECAMMFSELGCKVTMVEMLPNMLAIADDMVIELVEKQLKKFGITTVNNVSVSEILPDGLAYKDETRVHRIQAECTVVATGRVPNTDIAMLDALGIQCERGRIVTDDCMRTSLRGVYAIGDANGKSMLAHTARREAFVAVRNIMGESCTMSYDAIPTCVYSIPEIAWVGLTEREVRKMGIEYKVGKFPMRANGKSLIEGETDGWIKVIADSHTGEILGAHLVCAHATEMVMEFAVLMSVEGTIEDMVEAVHPHPTVSEGAMEAAEAVFGLSIHY